MATPRNNAITQLRTLWRARLDVRGGKDEFMFRATNEFSEAADLAETLLQQSPSSELLGARIVSVERVAKLWN